MASWHLEVSGQNFHIAPPKHRGYWACGSWVSEMLEESLCWLRWVGVDCVLQVAGSPVWKCTCGDSGRDFHRTIIFSTYFPFRANKWLIFSLDYTVPKIIWIWNRVCHGWSRCNGIYSICTYVWRFLGQIYCVMNMCPKARHIPYIRTSI